MIFKMLSKVPLFGEALRILNTYAFKGDARADEQFANPLLWLSAFWFPILVAGAGAALSMPELVNRWLPAGYCLTYTIEATPGTLATGILPNLLGFGIGIYALIFGLHKILLRELQDTFKPSPGKTKPPVGSALILNAEMAVPLLILGMAIIIGVVQQALPNHEYIKLAAWFFLWLAMVFTLELVFTLFGLGENMLLKNLDDKSQ
ncbi:MAG: hypothetical protein HZY78_14335 [Burkholderiaceae bacterium]|nr:MAG: hypothetical protein HZY78_14335 [Burkholderiaceae bacterium]